VRLRSYSTISKLIFREHLNRRCLEFCLGLNAI
jgi:hypothetical protein